MPRSVRSAVGSPVTLSDGEVELRAHHREGVWVQHSSDALQLQDEPAEPGSGGAEQEPQLDVTGLLERVCVGAGPHFATLCHS